MWLCAQVCVCARGCLHMVVCTCMVCVCVCACVRAHTHVCMHCFSSDIKLHTCGHLSHTFSYLSLTALQPLKLGQ